MIEGRGKALLLWTERRSWRWPVWKVCDMLNVWERLK